MFYTVKWLSRPLPINYFGTGEDGDLSTVGSVSYTSTSNGDAVVKHYNNLTINGGHTVTTQNPCKGLLIYVKGDCTINGTLTMNAKSSAGIGPSGSLRIYRASSGGTSQTTASIMLGTGPAAEAAEANQTLANATGIARAIVATGGTGGAGSNNANFPGANGNTATNSGGGGGGGGRYESQAGNGTDGSCYGGGTGGFGEADNDGSNVPGGRGGGNLVLIVKGNLTIGGAVTANGANGGDGAAPSGGGSGGGGGGIITLLYGGTYSLTSTLTANGGTGGYGTAYSSNGGSGAAGSVYTAQVLAS